MVTLTGIGVASWGTGWAAGAGASSGGAGGDVGPGAGCAGSTAPRAAVAITCTVAAAAKAATERARGPVERRLDPGARRLERRREHRLVALAHGGPPGVGGEALPLGGPDRVSRLEAPAGGVDEEEPRDPERVAAAYTRDSVWRNRSEFLTGRDEIVAFLRRKWATELDYVLRKDLWAFTGNRIGVRFQYEWHDTDGQWWRSYGNELWEFDELGYMSRREASINDVRIDEAERRIHGPRTEGDDSSPPLG